VPLIAVFYGARSAGVGEQVVQAVRSSSAVSLDLDDAHPAKRYVKETARGWLDEGEQFVGRVGRRYEIWGFEKRTAGDKTGHDTKLESEILRNAAGDVANALVAYGVTKVQHLSHSL